MDTVARPARGYPARSVPGRRLSPAGRDPALAWRTSGRICRESDASSGGIAARTPAIAAGHGRADARISGRSRSRNRNGKPAMKFRSACMTVLLLLTAAPAMAETVKQPALVVETLDGKTFDLATHRGQWVVVNYWATWCGPCIAEMPELSAFIKARADVEGIGLAYEDTERQEILDFLKQRPVDYPIAQIDANAPPQDVDIPRGLDRKS